MHLVTEFDAMADFPIFNYFLYFPHRVPRAVGHHLTGITLFVLLTGVVLASKHDHLTFLLPYCYNVLHILFFNVVSAYKIANAIFVSTLEILLLCHCNKLRLWTGLVIKTMTDIWMTNVLP